LVVRHSDAKKLSEKKPLIKAVGILCFKVNNFICGQVNGKPTRTKKKSKINNSINNNFGGLNSMGDITDRNQFFL
jgi:hypothetical protein